MWYKNKFYLNSKWGFNKRRGFTVAELLIVIAILSVLSGIVIFSLSSSQEKAVNSKRLSLIEHYATALEMYRQTNEYYPTPTGISGTCLGASSCGLNATVSEDIVLNNKIKQYMSTLAPLPNLKLLNPANPNNTSWDGVVYSCVTTVPLGCDRYSMTWFMQGPGSPSCGIGKITPNTLSSDTKCVYKSMIFK